MNEHTQSNGNVLLVQKVIYGALCLSLGGIYAFYHFSQGKIWSLPLHFWFPAILGVAFALNLFFSFFTGELWGRGTVVNIERNPKVFWAAFVFDLAFVALCIWGATYYYFQA